MDGRGQAPSDAGRPCVMRRGSLQQRAIPTSPARFAGSSYGQHSEGSLGATGPAWERSFERTSPRPPPGWGRP